MTKIKICGIKTLKDALTAIDAGADYLGFNFYPKSVRFIEKETCAEIASILKREHPSIKLVGVFVNSSMDEVKNVLDTCSLDLAQLHGDETPEMVESFNGKAFKALRLHLRRTAFVAVQVSASISVDESVYPFLKSVPESASPAFLIDAAVKGVYGGSGVTADSSAAAELAKRYPLLLAGGLTPDNVADAVRQVKPWGVDVASGVESGAGEKDASKMKAFVKAVNQRALPVVLKYLSGKFMVILLRRNPQQRGKQDALFSTLVIKVAKTSKEINDVFNVLLIHVVLSFGP
jgi:phosphoribosylanthranilate isomerase